MNRLSELKMCIENDTFNPFPHIYTLKKKSIGKHCGKGEIAQNEQFHLFLKCFPCNLYLQKSFYIHISLVVCSFFEFGMVSKWCIREQVNKSKTLGFLFIRKKLFCHS